MNNMDNIKGIALAQYEASFDPHYEDNEEEQKEQDPFDLVDEWFDENYEEEESESNE
jgi:hypothetical protein